MINYKHIYTLATLNGITHKEVKEYIWKEWGLGSTKDLDEQQYKSLITYLDREVKPMAEEKVLAKGFFGKGARDGAPSFVKGGMSVKVDDAIVFLQANKNADGWVNIDFLENKNDASKWNAFLNTWKKGESAPAPKAEAPKPAPSREIPATEVVEEDPF